MKSKGIILIVAVVVILLGYSSAYIVDETEQVVVTQFGKVVGKTKVDSGLYFKIPFIQHTTYFPKNLLEWDGDPGQIPTLDKTYIWVDTFARWRIVDAIKFFQTVNNTTSARLKRFVCRPITQHRGRGSAGNLSIGGTAESRIWVAPNLRRNRLTRCS